MVSSLLPEQFLYSNLNPDSYFDHNTVTAAELIIEVAETKIASLKLKEAEERKRLFARENSDDPFRRNALQVGDKTQSVSPMINEMYKYAKNSDKVAQTLLGERELTIGSNLTTFTQPSDSVQGSEDQALCSEP